MYIGKEKYGIRKCTKPFIRPIKKRRVLSARSEEQELI